MTIQVRLPLLAATAAAVALLSGCANPAAPTGSVPVEVRNVTFRGTVHGGQQPVANVRVHLYAAGSTGYGSAYNYATGTDLLGNNVVTTDAFGNFTLPNYTCPSSTTNVYFVGIGGNPVAGMGANSNLALMAAFGPCPASNSNYFVNINELTTVAAVYALAPFMTGAANVGTSSTNAVGLNNAFATVNNLISNASGGFPAPSLPIGAVAPTAEMNTLADIIATCVNSTGGSATGTVSDGSPCGNLFALTDNASGVAPTDTITATLNIARNPGQNAGLLSNLAIPASPYQPTVTMPSTGAWTLAITYPGPGAGTGPTGIAADQQGNIWVANKTANSVTLMSPTGGVTGTYASGAAGSGAIAIDPSGNAWVPGTGASLLEIPAGGGTYASHTGGGLGTTNALAIDGLGQIWATGSQNGVSVFSNSGAPLSATAYTGLSASNAQSIAITSH
jgi:hypothetical protein